MKPSVDNKHHQHLVEDVSRMLEERGYIVDQVPYHSGALKAETVRRLTELHTMTSLYLRTQPDGFAIHQTRPVCFFWEAKTNDGEYRNVAIEALPLCHHLLARVACVYVYRDVVEGFQGGMWCNPSAVVSLRKCRIIIPDRWDDKLAGQFEALFRDTIPGVSIDRRPSFANGSNDPFIVIRRNRRAELFSEDWISVIDSPVDLDKVTTVRSSRLLEVVSHGQRTLWSST